MPTDRYTLASLLTNVESNAATTENPRTYNPRVCVFHAFAAKQMRSALFWNTAQRVVVVVVVVVTYRRFGKTYIRPSNLKNR
jgi:hypothetical protein